MKILLKRCSSKALDNYIGNIGEIAINQDDNSLRVFDGTTFGGNKITNYLKQENSNYIVFENGLIIQFVRVQSTITITPGEYWSSVCNLPISMSNTNYVVSVAADYATKDLQSGGEEIAIGNKTTSKFNFKYHNRNVSTDVSPNLGIGFIVIGY